MLPRGCRFVSVPETSVPPHTTARLEPLPGREPFVVGEFLYVDDPTDIFFQLRTRDKSRNASSAGTAIPVIGSANGKKRQQLLNVPVDNRFRYTLRVYTFDSVRGNDLPAVPQNRMRVYDLATDTLLVDQPLIFNGFEFESPCSGFAYPFPNSSSDLFAAQPQLSGKTVRIEIESNFYYFWAMLTITNNDTNEVTVVVP
jgi:hypothetical protein